MLMRTIPAGDTLIDLIKQCVDADQPLLLRGVHGIGKSDLFKIASERLGIGFISRDLSLMEPSDLIGMPRIDNDGRTRFAPPAFLPNDGRGLLTIEEINRAPRYMVAPCLQLLTERRLNDYELPPGWIPMAAINPGGADYLVDDLDPALLARFVQVEVAADVTQWAAWARTQGGVHRSVIEFAQRSPGIFAPGETNPRALTYLSKQLVAWESGPRDPEILIVAAAGLVGETWAVAFYQFLTGGEAPLTSADVVDQYESQRDKFRSWANGGQLDLVRASIHPVKQFLEQQVSAAAIAKDEKRKQNIRGFIEDLPADLRREMRHWLAEKNFEPLL